MVMDEEVTVEDINELTVRLEALSNILTIVMNALSQSDPSLHAYIPRPHWARVYGVFC
ncbi:hypothetical protein AB7W30_22605 [Providencia manganoxydans]|uniref:hypothetical protein n=1 Tax=Providencia manganoxydans TaxID=2923283 RepID=UPI0032DBC9A3